MLKAIVRNVPMHAGRSWRRCRGAAAAT